MSCCRWSCPVPEETPDVDVSFEKMTDKYREGGIDCWSEYLEKNKVKNSQAYVYADVSGGYTCYWVGHEDDTINLETAQEMAEYLKEQKDNGYLVPQYAIDGLLAEDEE